MVEMKGGEEPESCASCRDERMRTIKLLDDYWFCQNMLLYGSSGLNSSAKVFCTRNSMEMVEEKQDEELTSTATDAPTEENPLRKDRKEADLDSAPVDLGKTNDLYDNHSFLRAPCLPSYTQDLKLVNGEDGSNGVRQPSLQRSFSSFDTYSSIPSHRNDRQFNKSFLSRPERRETSGDFRAQSQRRIRKSLSDLEEEEVQGFRDLGFTFNKEDMSPSLLNMIPGLQAKRVVDNDKVRRPYLSEAWIAQRSDPPKLNWDETNLGFDMKEQLRVWAKNVASNVN